SGAPSPGPGRRARAPRVALAAALGFACGDASPPTRADAQASPALAPDHGAAAASPEADAAAPFAALGLAPLAPEPRAAWPTESPHITSYFGWRVNPITGTGQKL